jgi:hypothetical protein
VPVYPVPSDATYDYVPLPGTSVAVGSDVLAVMQSEGEVASASEEAEYWTYVLDSATPDGQPSVGFAFFPLVFETQPDEWWLRLRLWVRADKLADGATLTADDGSEWIYPAGEDGKMVCYESGSTFTRGDRRSRGEISTDPRDLYTADDSEYDWLPVTDGSTVAEDDVVLFGYATTGVVDEAAVGDYSPYYIRTAFARADSDTLGWYDVLGTDGSLPSLAATWSWFERLAKPAAETTFLAPDGSRWIYGADALYYCWGTGTTYVTGALFNRGEIDGGLTEIT